MLMSKSVQILFVLILLGGVLFFPPADAFSASTLQYSWNMDTDPGWSTEGLWAWGVPQGLGGTGQEDGYGYPDPTSGHTGTHVYGYNLSGNYEPNLPATHLITKPIDCTGLSNVKLEFWMWLGVEKWDDPFGDHADVEVSNDGINWTTIANNLGLIFNGGSWQFFSFDTPVISSVADGQPTVYIRWTMGPTDSGWNYCGFNIDDVEIWGVSSVTPPTVTTGSATSVSSTSATLNGTVNPNGASTTVSFDYGLTTGYGNSATASQSPLTGTSTQNVSALISGLNPGSTYHFRVKATNTGGTTYGSDRTFSPAASCPECSGTVVTLDNATFPSGKECQCIATVSMAVGTNVTVESGAVVTFKSPKVTLSPGFRANSGATLHIKK